MEAEPDPLRPLFHFACPRGAAHPFDPNGAIYWKGRYHLFYIFQEHGLAEPAGWGRNCCWGHVSSTDLIHWQEHPVALVPDRAAGEEIYSGNAFLDKNGRPTIAYNGVSGVCIATSSDDLLNTWVKHPSNPVIPVGHDLHLWLEGEFYYVLLGGSGVVEMAALDAAREGEGDTGDLYRSRDLVNWKPLGRFYKSQREWTGPCEDCACPDFFQIGGRSALVFMSHQQGTQYYLGCRDGERFVPERHDRLNWSGGTMIAPESLLDDRGRRILWNWACEARTIQAQGEVAWSGVLTLPWEVTLSDREELCFNPAEELGALRGPARCCRDLRLEPGVDHRLDGVEGGSFELSLVVRPGDADRVVCRVLVSPDGSEETAVICDLRAQTLCIDGRRSSLDPRAFAPWPNPWSAHHPLGRYAREEVRNQEAPFALESGEPLELRIFVDRSIIEVFANRRRCLVQRVYPTRPDSLGVSLGCEGGVALVEALDFYPMHALSVEPLSSCP